MFSVGVRLVVMLSIGVRAVVVFSVGVRVVVMYGSLSSPPTPPPLSLCESVMMDEWGVGPGGPCVPPPPTQTPRAGPSWPETNKQSESGSQSHTPSLTLLTSHTANYVTPNTPYPIVMKNVYIVNYKQQSTI